jgi:hypothetical protein
MKKSEIKPATFRLVVQRLNQLRHSILHERPNGDNDCIKLVVFNCRYFCRCVLNLPLNVKVYFNFLMLSDYC